MAKLKTTNVKRLDPLNVDARLYEQVSLLLDQLQEPSVTIRERTMALAAIARIRISYVKLSEDSETNAGATIRKYSNAFAANAAGGRGKLSRSRATSTDALDDGLSEFDEDIGGTA